MTLAASPPLRHLCSDRNKAFSAFGETIVVKTRGADMDHVDIIDAVYQAAVHSEQWPDTLCSIVDYVGAVAGNIVYQAPGFSEYMGIAFEAIALEYARIHIQ
ncbi:hypothetical protein ACCS78_22210, partial [Rhizobium johnstonii]